MSFWKTSAGTEATGEVKENNLDALPKDWYTMMLEEVANKEWEDDRYINIKARVVAGPMQNRVVFLKLKVYETTNKFYKESARDNALEKLVRLYQILGVKLPAAEPDDRSLSQLADKPLDVYLEVWKDQETKEPKGNFIGNFAAKGEKAGTAAKAVVKPAPQTAKQAMDSDIPF